MWYNFFKRPFVPTTLPESYTNLFTWEEQLRCLIKDVYDFVDFFNNELDNLGNDVDLKIKREVSKAKAELQAQINAIKDQADQVYNRLNAEMAALRRDVSSTATTLRSEMASLRDTITQLMEDLDTDVDSRLRLLYKKVEDTKNALLIDISNALNEAKIYTNTKVREEEIERINGDNRLERMIANLQFKLPNIYNPTKGLLGSVGQTICDLYNYLSYGGLRINQTIDNNISVDYFDDNEIKVEYIDTKMGYVLDTAKELSIWSPFSGKKERVDKIIYEVVRQINVNNKKVETFTDNDITVDTIDDSSFNAWEMGTRHWVNDDTPFGLKDIERVDYTLLYESNKVSQQAFDITVKSYDYYMIKALFVATGLTTKNYIVKNNTSFDLTNHQMVNDQGIKDRQVISYRYGEVQKNDNQTQFRFEDGYYWGADVSVKTDTIIVAGIYGINFYNDLSTKED